MNGRYTSAIVTGLMVVLMLFLHWIFLHHRADQGWWLLLSFGIILAELACIAIGIWAGIRK